MVVIGTRREADHGNLSSDSTARFTGIKGSDARAPASWRVSRIVERCAMNSPQDSQAKNQFIAWRSLYATSNARLQCWVRVEYRRAQTRN